MRRCCFALLGFLVAVVGAFTAVGTVKQLWTIEGAPPMEIILTTHDRSEFLGQKSFQNDDRFVAELVNRIHNESLRGDLIGNKSRAHTFHGPGTYFAETPIYIWSARLATDLDRPRELMFNFWVQNPAKLVDTWIKIDGKHAKFNKTLGLLSTKEIRDLRLNVNLTENKDLENRGITQCTTMPNLNIDSLAANTFYRFQCNLTGLVELRDDYVAEWTIRLSNDANETVEFHLSSTRIAVGDGASRVVPSLPFHKRRRRRMTLCIGGVNSRGVHFLKEFLYHHMKLGIDSFLISIHALNSISGAARVNNDITKTTGTVEKMFAGLVAAGIIDIIPMELPVDFTWIHRDVLKMLFYEHCLFQAKGQSGFVGNWDIDEFLMPTAEYLENLTDRKTPIDRVLENIQPNPSCPDWCFVTVPSYSVFTPPGNKAPASETIESIAHTFPVRSEYPPNYVWQKSIAKTKNAFNSGFHLFGSCLVNGQLNGNFTAAHYKESGCSRRVPELGSIHHYLGIFYGKPVESDHFDPPFVEDEYSAYAKKNANEPLWIEDVWNASKVLFRP